MITLRQYSVQRVYQIKFVWKYEKCQSMKVSHVLTFQVFSNSYH